MVIGSVNKERHPNCGFCALSAKGLADWPAGIRDELPYGSWGRNSRSVLALSQRGIIQLSLMTRTGFLGGHS
jgi:hypothetical protein